jgi:excisionase family DNA binding protein
MPKIIPDVETTLLAALLSVPEFAERLNVKPATVRRWLLLRKITSVKIGRSIRIFSSEADRLIAEGIRPAIERRGRTDG